MPPPQPADETFPDQLRSVQRPVDDPYSDTLDRADLDEVFPGFADGKTPIRWGAAIRLARPGPPSEVILGPDWVLSFKQKETTTIPGSRGENPGEVVDLEIEPPTALLSVITHETTVNGARDLGRPRLRALIGTLEARHAVLRTGEIAWEGPIRATQGDQALFGTGHLRVELKMDDVGVEKLRRAMTPFALDALTSPQAMALGWVFEAWSARSNVVRFVDYWFAIVALADGGASPAGRRKPAQMTRVKNYLDELPIGTLIRADILTDLRTAYKTRNRIIHDGDQFVRAENLSALVDRVHEVLRYELGRSPR